jgi:hypothetical protein
MQTNEKSPQQEENDQPYLVLRKEYWLMVANVISDLRKDMNVLKGQIEEREKLLDAHGVKQKFDIGRDLLAFYRKRGLPHVRIGRKFFYRASDILEFCRNFKYTHS